MAEAIEGRDHGIGKKTSAKGVDTFVAGRSTPDSGRAGPPAAAVLGAGLRRDSR